ncbi:hypothetical protein JCM10296v2_007836 [Rhodotorula toruloides]
MAKADTNSTPRASRSPAREHPSSPSHAHHPLRLDSASGPLMPVVGRKTGLEGFLPESENLAGGEGEKEREEMVDEEDDGEEGGAAGEQEESKNAEEKLTSPDLSEQVELLLLVDPVACLSLAPKSTSPSSSESDASPVPPIDVASLVAAVDPAIKELPLPSPPPPGAYIFPDGHGRASFSSDMESPPPAHASDVLKGVAAGASGRREEQKHAVGVKSGAASETADPKHPVLLLLSAFFASSTCLTCLRPLQAFTAKATSTTISGEQAKEAVLRHWGCLRIQVEEGKMGVALGA